MPTLRAVAGANYPSDASRTAFRSNRLRGREPAAGLHSGKRLPDRPIYCRYTQEARGVIQGDWKAVWWQAHALGDSVRSNLQPQRRTAARSSNLAERYPERVKQLAAQWEQYFVYGARALPWQVSRQSWFEACGRCSWIGQQRNASPLETRTTIRPVSDSPATASESGSAKRPETQARRDCDVLPAADHVGHRRSLPILIHLEMPEWFAALRVKRHKGPAVLPEKNEVSVTGENTRNTYALFRSAHSPTPCARFGYPTPG